MAELDIDSRDQKHEARALAKEKLLHTARSLYAMAQAPQDDDLSYPENAQDYHFLDEFNRYGVSITKPYYDNEHHRALRKQALKGAINCLKKAGLICEGTYVKDVVAKLDTTPENLRETIEAVGFVIKPRIIEKYHKALVLALK